MQTHGKKPVVYLDQNWLSEITKAHLGLEANVDRSYFLELYRVIQNGVAQDRFVCPTSYFHESESTSSFQLNTDLRSVDNTLSRGLSFNSNVGISHEQLLQAASEFSRVEGSFEHWWRIPFSRDPDTPDSTLPRPTGGIEVYLTIEEMVRERRRVRNQVSAPMYQKYKEFRKGVDLSYKEEIEFSRLQLLKESYVGLGKAISLLGETPLGLEAIHWITVMEQEQRFRDIVQICSMRDGFKAFLSSGAFYAAPFLSVRAKLMAADIVYESSRMPEPSLLEDFDIVATILPYSDVFATENYIAELLRKTKLAEEYCCRVFTMRQKDDFLNLLSSI